MLLTDHELTVLRRSDKALSDDTLVDLPLAYHDRRNLLEHIDTLNQEFHFVPKADTPMDMPEWEEELLLTMCNVTDVRIQLRLIESLREEVAEKESMIEWLRDA